MRKECFVIPYPPNMTAFCKRYGLNAYWSGKHWGERKADADAFHSLTAYSVLQSKIPKELFKSPVSITFYHNDRMDIDNHAAIEKMIVDALKGLLLVDDSKRWYAKKTTCFWGGNGIKVEIEEATP